MTVTTRKRSKVSGSAITAVSRSTVPVAVSIKRTARRGKDRQTDIMLMGPRWDDVYQAYRFDVYYRQFGAVWSVCFWVREWLVAAQFPEALRHTDIATVRQAALALAGRRDGVLYRTMMGQEPKLV